MKKLKRYFANAVLMAGVSVLLRTAAVSFNVWVSEKAGAVGMGLYSLIGNVYSLALTFATSGIHLAATRLTAKALLAPESGRQRELRNTVRSCILYSLLFSVPAALTLFFTAPWIGANLLCDTRTVPSLRLMSAALPPVAMSSALSGYFCGVRRVGKNAVNQLIEQGARIFLISNGILLLSPYGVEYTCLAMAAGGMLAELISCAVNAVLYLFDKDRRSTFSKKGSPSEKNSAAFKAVFGIAFPVAVSAYVRSALTTVEHLAIPWGLRRGGEGADAALASYGILQGMVFPLAMFPTAILGAAAGLLIPELTEYHSAGDMETIRRIAGKTLQVSLFFATGTAAVFFCFASEFGQILYHSSEASHYLCLIAPLIPVMYTDSAVDSILKGVGEQLHSMKINIADAAISTALVFLLIPRFGVVGYVAVIYICELFNIAMSLRRLTQVTGLILQPVQWVLLPAAAAVLSAALLRPLFGAITAPASLALSVTAVAAGYIAVMAIVWGRHPFSKKRAQTKQAAAN